MEQTSMFNEANDAIVLEDVRTSYKEFYQINKTFKLI